MPLPANAFNNNETPILASNVPRNPPLCFFVSLITKGNLCFKASISLLFWLPVSRLLIWDKLIYSVNGDHKTTCLSLSSFCYLIHC